MPPFSSTRVLRPARASHAAPNAQRPLTRRSVLGAGLGLGGALLLSACAAGDTAPIEVGEPLDGGVLTYFEPQTWTTLYPPAAGFYPNGGILNNISARLLHQDAETLELRPWIATELPTIEDSATVFTFRLRPGVTYSDGTPLTAANVVKNFDLFGRGDNTRALAISEQIANYESGEVIDDSTVRFRFSAPSPGFAQAVSTMNAGLLSDAALDLDSEGFGPGSATAVATCGPFYIDSEEVGTRLSVRVREDYDWAPPHFEHQGPAYLAGIDYTVNQEYSVRIGALVSGQAHGVRGVEAPDEARVAEAGLNVLAAPTNGINNCLSFRSRHPLLAELPVRQALIAAVDRERIVRTLFTDNYQLATGILAQGAAGYRPAPGAWEYDPEGARALLDSAGWIAGEDGVRSKAGTRLQLAVNIALPQPRSREVMTLVQQDFARIGVGLTINEGDAATQTVDSLDIDTIQIYHSMVARADYDVVASQWSINNRDAFLNYDEETDTWGDEEVEIILQDVTDSAAAADREAAVHQLQDHFIAQALVLPLFEEPQVYGFRRRVQGFTSEPVGRPVFYDTWLAAEGEGA